MENRVNNSGIEGTYMGKSWYFNSRMSFETYGNCCQMLLQLLKLSRSSFFNISSVGFIKGLLAYIYFE
jgi:hypothetical protein